MEVRLREFANLVTVYDQILRQMGVNPRSMIGECHYGDLIGDGKFSDVSDYNYPNCDCCGAYSRNLRRYSQLILYMYCHSPGSS